MSISDCIELAVFLFIVSFCTAGLAFLAADFVRSLIIEHKRKGKKR